MKIDRKYHSILHQGSIHPKTSPLRYDGNFGVGFVRRALPRGWLCMGCRKSHTPCTSVFSLTGMRHVQWWILNGDLTTYCSEPKTTGSLWYVALNSLTLELLGFIKTPMSLHTSQEVVKMIQATAALFGPQLFQSSTWSPRIEIMATSQEVLQLSFAKRTRHGSIKSTKRFRQRYPKTSNISPPERQPHRFLLRPFGWLWSDTMDLSAGLCYGQLGLVAASLLNGRLYSP